MSEARSVEDRIGAAGWVLGRPAGETVLRCAALARIPGLRHGFSTAARDAGSAGCRDAARLEDRRAFLEAVGLAGREVVFPSQVHGRRVIAAERFETIPEADAVGLVRREHPGLAVGVRTADCVPLLLADRSGAAAVAVHAGWRGTAAGISGEGVRWLAARGVRGSDVVAAVGPSAGVCCYEVSEEVAEAVVSASGGEASGLVRPGRSGRPHLDLGEANRRQLVAAGVPADAVHPVPLCTICSSLALHSFRRDAAAAGRMMAVAGFSP